jgi:hypothetical protein
MFLVFGLAPNLSSDPYFIYHLSTGTLYATCKGHTLIWVGLVQELPLNGYLGGRDSSLGESKGRGSMLEVSRSRESTSLTSPSLEDGTSWVLEVEAASRSLPLRGLPAPSFLAEVLGGDRESKGQVMAVK